MNSFLELYPCQIKHKFSFLEDVQMLMKGQQFEWHGNKQQLFSSEACFTEAMRQIVSTHRHVVSIDVVFMWASMNNREFHPRKVI